MVHSHHLSFRRGRIYSTAADRPVSDARRHTLCRALLYGTRADRAALRYHSFPPAGDVSGFCATTRSGLVALFYLVAFRSEEHTSELQSHSDLVCRLLL